LTYLNVTLTGKVQRWKLYLLDKDFYLCHVPGKEVHQFVPVTLSRLCENHMLSNKSEKPAHKRHQAFLASIEPKHRISDAVFQQIARAATTGASEAAGCIFQHFGRFETPDVIHTDQGPAFRNELFSELSRLSQVEHSFDTAYSKEENGLVERANQRVMRHLRAMLFDARVHDKWSYEQLPMV
jgi:transposase InsO family protein